MEAFPSVARTGVLRGLVVVAPTDEVVGIGLHSVVAGTLDKRLPGCISAMRAGKSAVQV